MTTAGNTGETPVRSIHWKIALRNTAYILAALFIFLFALDLMISTLEHVGKAIAETIILATSNPFTGLFIGLLVTAIIQSSSAATSIVVALVASGAITIEGAVPIIMGANIGTTITSAIVSLGFITRKKEFKRAVAAGTYHSFFNILTAVVLFPLEYYYSFLSKASQYLATTFFHEPIGPLRNDFSFLGSGLKPTIEFIIKNIDSGPVLILLSVALIFGSILFFRKILSGLLGFGSQERFQRFFFRSPLKSFAWGVLTTAAIRSSTVTTSLVVPLVAKKVVKMRAAVPFILGANIGTTITAFIAAMFNSNAAISIAIAHFLFNFIGVLIFFPIPYLREIPIRFATGLGALTLKHRVVGFIYLLMTFFFIPFSLIFFNKKTVVIRELTYTKSSYDGYPASSFKVITKTDKNSPFGSWKINEVASGEITASPKVISVQRRDNQLLIQNQIFIFNTPGYCWQGKDQKGSYKMCVRDIKNQFRVNVLPAMDSVFVFEKQRDIPEPDSVTTWYYISAPENILVRKERRSSKGNVITYEELAGLGDR